MMAAAKKHTKKPRPPKISEDEKAQVRARAIVGHTFALNKDEHQRTRLVVGTAESRRPYDISTSGTTVRLRNVDPLKGIMSLSDRQRDAGARYREDYQIANREGLGSGSFSEHVDGGALYKGIPAHLLDSAQELRNANRVLGHSKIVGVVEAVCGLSMSVNSYAASTKTPPVVALACLGIGLDKLADHYRPKRYYHKKQG